MSIDSLISQSKTSLQRIAYIRSLGSEACNTVLSVGEISGRFWACAQLTKKIGGFVYLYI
jgi:hypothetical protein